MIRIVRAEHIADNGLVDRTNIPSLVLAFGRVTHVCAACRTGTDKAPRRQRIARTSFEVLGTTLAERAPAVGVELVTKTEGTREGEAGEDQLLPGHRDELQQSGCCGVGNLCWDWLSALVVGVSDDDIKVLDQLVGRWHDQVTID